jgi:hypothetical protein
MKTVTRIQETELIKSQISHNRAKIDDDKIYHTHSVLACALLFNSKAHRPILSEYSDLCIMII